MADGFHDYEALLEKAYEELPAKVKEHSRFEPPVISSIIQGKLTVVQNLGEVAKAVNRTPEMLTKWLLKELGTSGNLEGSHLIVKGQFRQPTIQEKFKAFLDQYVICPECKRPDTRIEKEDRVTFLKCEACGSRHPLGGMRASTRKVEKKFTPSIGQEITVDITSMGKKGDGVAHSGEYIIYVKGKGVKKGQKVKAKINGVRGTRVFARALEFVQ